MPPFPSSYVDCASTRSAILVSPCVNFGRMYVLTRGTPIISLGGASNISAILIYACVKNSIVVLEYLYLKLGSMSGCPCSFLMVHLEYTLLGITILKVLKANNISSILVTLYLNCRRVCGYPNIIPIFQEL